MASRVSAWLGLRHRSICWPGPRRLLRRHLSQAPSIKLWHVSEALAQGLGGLGVQTPNAVQAEAIPLAMSGRDTLVVSQTGSGKTLMFLLPILQQLTASDEAEATAVVLAPTAALASQHTAVACQLAAGLQTPLAIESLAEGAEGAEGGEGAGSPRPRLLIGTPECWLASAHLACHGPLLVVAIDEVDAVLFDSEHSEALSVTGRALLAALGRGGAARDELPQLPPLPQLLLATAHLSAAHAAALQHHLPGAARVSQRASAGGVRGTLAPSLRQAFHYFRGDKQAKLLALLQREVTQPVGLASPPAGRLQDNPCTPPWAARPGRLTGLTPPSLLPGAGVARGHRRRLLRRRGASGGAARGGGGGAAGERTAPPPRGAAELRARGVAAGLPWGGGIAAARVQQRVGPGSGLASSGACDHA